MTHAPRQRMSSARGPRFRIKGNVGVAMGITFALAACGPAATSAPQTAAPTSPAATSTAAVPTTAPPATQAGPAEACSEAPACEMPAGSYHASLLDGGITFRLHGDIWTNVAYLPEILSLRDADDWVVFMRGDVRLAKGDGVLFSHLPANVRRLLGKLPGITVTPVDEPVLIDGAEAVVFDVSNTGTETTTLWGLGQTSGTYSLDPGAFVRMHWVDRAGVPFILALESPESSFPAFLEDSTVVIESIVFD